MINYLGLAAALVMTSSAAIATDRVGYRAIAAGDFAAAVTKLEAERRIHPQRPELMLNLAAVYRSTGRSAEARALYQEVLARPVVMLDLPNGDVVSSRVLAAKALARTNEIASR